MGVGPRDLLDELARVRNPQAVGSESSQTHDAKIVIAEHDRVRRAPFHIRELFGVDKINFRFHRRIKPEFPRAQLRKYRRVAAVDRIAAGCENVTDLAFKDKDGRLRLANDQLRSVLYLLARNRKTINKRVLRFVQPFDHLDKLVESRLFYFVDKTHFYRSPYAKLNDNICHNVSIINVLAFRSSPQMCRLIRETLYRLR